MKDKTNELQSCILLEVMSFNAQSESLVKCDTELPKRI